MAHPEFSEAQPPAVVLEAAVEPLVDARFRQIRHEITSLSKRARGTFIKNFYQDAGDELDANPEFVKSFKELSAVVDGRRGEPAPSTEIVYTLHKSIQAIEQAADPAYPLGKDKPGAWRPIFQKVTNDPEYQAAFLMNGTRPIATNDPGRGKLIKEILLLLDMQGELAIGEGGTSLGHILKKLVLVDEGKSEYSPTMVRQWDEERQRFMARPQQSHVLRQHMNQQSLGIEFGVGIDLYDIREDKDFQNWATSNFFDIDGLRDTKKHVEHRQLLKYWPDLLKFLEADMTDDSFIARYNKKLPKAPKLDAFIFSTMLYEISSKERPTVLKHAQNCLKDDGIIIVQDFADIDNHGNLTFYDKWTDWTYNLLVWQDGKWEKYFTADGGRVKQVQLCPALGDLALANQLGLVPH